LLRGAFWRMRACLISSGGLDAVLCLRQR
jgi:hypothetical protein